MRRSILSVAACLFAAAILTGSAAADEVTFTFVPQDGPEVAAVSVRGSFNEWGETPMVRQEDGTWSLTLDLVPGEYYYKYFVNEAWPQDMSTGLGGAPLDPIADGYKPDGYGGFNAVRYVGVPAPDDAGDGTPYKLRETVISENESLFEIEAAVVKNTNVAAQSMRMMYELHRLAVDRGFRYLTVKEDGESHGQPILRVTFHNEVPDGYTLIDLARPKSLPQEDLDPNKTVLDAQSFVETWDKHLEDGGDWCTPPGSPGVVRVYGYRVDDDVIVFTFTVADHDGATRHGDGRWFDLRGMAVESVAVAGDFNDWSRSAWVMQDAGEGVYEYRKPVSELGSPSEWQFKFVVNEIYWAEPLGGAANVVTSDFGSRNLALKIE